MVFMHCWNISALFIIIFQFNELKMCFSFGNNDRKCFNSILGVWWMQVLSLRSWWCLEAVLLINLIIVIRTNSFFYWENSKSRSVRGYQGVRKPYFEPFLPIFWNFKLLTENCRNKLKSGKIRVIEAKDFRFWIFPVKERISSHDDY